MTELSLPPDARSPLARLQSVKKRRTITVRIAVDPDEASRVSKLWDEARTARAAATNRPDRPTLAQAADEAEQTAREAARAVRVVEFEFASIGARRSEQIMRDHQATKDQQKAHQEGNPGSRLLYDPDTFPMARISAALIGVRLPDGGPPVAGLEPAELRELFDSAAWTTADEDRLLEAARAVDLLFNAVDLDAAGKG